MDCGQARSALGRMRSGEIDPETRRGVEHHLADCGSCRAELSPAPIAHFAGPAVAAVLFPDELHGVPRAWVYAVGALSASTLALAVAVGYLHSRPAPVGSERPLLPVVATSPEPEEHPEPEPAPSTAPTAAPVQPTSPEVAPAPAPAPALAPAPSPAAGAAALEPAAKATPSGATASRSRQRGEESTSGSGAREPARPAAPEPAAKPAPEPEPAANEPPPQKPKDEIEKLLFEAAGPVTSAPPVKEEKPPEATDATGLTRQQVMDVMGSIQDQIHACAVQTGKSGIVDIRATIVPSGRVKSVRVAGMFAGTPAGDCVAKAVRGAVFPTFVGQPQPVNYPIPLR